MATGMASEAAYHMRTPLKRGGFKPHVAGRRGLALVLGVELVLVLDLVYVTLVLVLILELVALALILVLVLVALALVVGLRRRRIVVGIPAFVAKTTFAIVREVKAGRRLSGHRWRGLPVPMQRSSHGGSVAPFALQVHRGLDDLHEVYVGAVGVILR